MEEGTIQNMQIKHSNQPKQLQAISNSIHTWKIKFQSSANTVVKLQWLKQPWNHDKMFETMVLRVSER